MSQQTEVGVILQGEHERDAIHIAIAPVIAAEDLHPSQLIGLVEDGNVDKAGTVVNPIGIVDPFLREMVFKGDRFFMFLFPNTITSLKHNWAHPAFVAKPADLTGPSKAWIKDFADRICQSYSELMDAAALWVSDEEYTYDNSETYKEHWNEFPEFWRHYEVVTGTKVRNKSEFFTCSC